MVKEYRRETDYCVDNEMLDLIKLYLNSYGFALCY